jgi:hypothetical protein
MLNSEYFTIKLNNPTYPNPSSQEMLKKRSNDSSEEKMDAKRAKLTGRRFK